MLGRSEEDAARRGRDARTPQTRRTRRRPGPARTLAGRPRRATRTCRSSRSPRRRRPRRWSCSATPPTRDETAHRAVPPLLDAAGDRGGLHPRRARELHDLRDLLPDREGDHRRPGVRRGARRGARSRASCRCTRTTSRRRPRSSSSTSARTPPRRSAGTAKAMVVTARGCMRSGIKQALDATSRSTGYDDVHALVAFSGTVIDEG